MMMKKMVVVIGLVVECAPFTKFFREVRSSNKTTFDLNILNFVSRLTNVILQGLFN